jgi:hypothetical protein
MTVTLEPLHLEGSSEPCPEPPCELPPEPPRRRRKARPLLVLGMGLMGMLALGILLPPMFGGCGVERGRNASMRANLSTVRMGLEQYATDHGRYPSTQQLVKELGRENYLPGNHLPATPWNREPQAVSISVAGTNLPTARQVANGQTPPPDLVVGRGEAPKGAPTNAYQYGAIVYDLDPKTQTYVLYGVVQKNKSAKVVEMVSNL